MKNKYNNWTKEKCQEESLKYKTRTNFQKLSKGAYSSAYRHNWLNDICSHMIEIKKPNGYWTYERCKKEALKYSKLKDFRNNSPSAYDNSYENGFLYDICKHMIFNRKCNNYWTKEKCLEASLKYISISDFKENDNAAYVAAHKGGWFSEISSHLKRKINRNGYWTKEKCQIETLKYSCKNDFRNNCSSAYNSSLKNGWLDEICSHMEVFGNKYKRCIYSYEFSNNFVYVGLTYNIDKRNIDHLKCGPVYNHIQSNTQYILKRLTDYVDVEVAKILEGEYVEKYKNEGWCILNKAKAGAVGSNTIKWTKEKCHEESLKYMNREEFRKNHSGVYFTSTRNG